MAGVADHRFPESAVVRVVLEEQTIRVRARRVVDGDDVELVGVAFEDATEREPSDAAESVDRDASSHAASAPFAALEAVVCRRDGEPVG